MATAGTVVPLRRSSWSWLVWWLPVAAVTGLIVGALGPDLAVLFGYRTLGPIASVGQPLARTLAVGAASVAAAGLLAAVVHVPGSPRGALTPTGFAALRVTGPACLVLVVAGLVVALLTVAESTGIRPGALLVDPPTLVLALVTVEAAAGWVIAALVAGIVGVVGGSVLTWRGATGVLVLFLAGLVVPPATAVANSERSHDWYGDALTLHTLAATLWLASTLATAGLLRRGLAGPAVLRRHDRLALGASIVLVLSGLVPTVLDVGVGGLGSGYGLLVVTSTVLLVGGLATIGRRGRPGSARRLLGVEIGLLTAATAAGTAMTRLIPPGAQIPEPPDASRLIFLLGYELPPRMGLAELAGLWRIDLLFAPAAALAALTYLLAVRRLARCGEPWPLGRTLAWIGGCVTVLVATSSGIGAYATAVFEVHLLGHALLSTVAPLLLVCGHPLTLVRRAARPRTAERVLALVEAAPLRVLSRPVPAWGVAAMAVFGVYATGLFDAVVLEHWSHPAMDALALGAGLLLFRAVLGARSPEPPVFVRLGLLFAVMMLHAGFAIWLLLQPVPLGGPFFAAVAMPFVPDLLAGQRAGAVLAWVVSDLAMIAAAAAQVRAWSSTDVDPQPGKGVFA